jgi:RND family efflux transporter MFP subunit
MTVNHVERGSGRKRPFKGGALLGCALASTLFILGCGDDDASAGGGRGGFPGASAVPVETDTAEVGRIARVIVIPGTVEPIRTLGVNAQLSGAVLQITVEEGDRVEEGQILARLDDRELQAQLRSAEASFTVAEAAYRRAEQLLARQVITQPEYEADQTAFAAAQAQLDQLRTRVGFTEVRAPISGLVTSKLVQSGDVVGNQARLLDLAEVDTMVVRVSISELDVVEISQGDLVNVRLDAFGEEVFTAHVRRIFPSADPTTRLVPVEVSLDISDPRRTRPGFLARVAFELAPREDAVIIPASAIVSRGGGEGVYLVADSTVVLRSITPGLSEGGKVEILGGLLAGDRVVTAGANLLRDGGLVRDMTLEQAATREASARPDSAMMPRSDR